MHRTLFAAALLFLAGPLWASEVIQLANRPALSPDGRLLAFDWAGDIWVVSSEGGLARPLTRHPARDTAPCFSPDGKTLAFVSDRLGSAQIFLVPLEGGEPRQVTHHTAGFDLHDWFPDGRLLTSGSRDHFWRGAERFLVVSSTERKPEQVLFDDYGTNGQLSADGKKLLFTREGTAWWRKGYRGSQASQIWLFDLEERRHQKLLHEETQCRWPLWKPDGSGFWYVGGPGKAQNLWEYNFSDGASRPVTRLTDDSVVFPCVSRDGSTLVFRHCFDFYLLRPGQGEPKKLAIHHNADRTADKINRRVLTTATQVAFNSEGTEIAFIAGGDLWVMDTELREPRQVTSTAEEERDPVFSPDGESIWYVSDRSYSVQPTKESDGSRVQTDLWRASRKDGTKPWFLNEQFTRACMTDDPDVESGLKFAPTGDWVAFIKGRGELWVMKPDGKEARKVHAGFSRPEFDWSPDGKWLVYSAEDTDFNRDIWLLPLDGSRPPFNVSRSPWPDFSPVWSPDGKKIAFLGARGEAGDAAGTREVDIFYVYLAKEEDEKDSRERAIEKSLEKIKKAKAGIAPTEPGKEPAATAPAGDPAATPTRPRRRDGDQAVQPAPTKPASSPPQPSPTKAEGEGAESEKKAEADRLKKPEPVKVVIDFDQLHERLRRIRIADSREADLLFSPDGKKLAFTATVEGKRGLYTVEFPDNLTPKLLSTTPLSGSRWLKLGNVLVGHVSGVPSSLSGSATSSTLPTPTSFRFSAAQTENLPAKNKAVFNLAWQQMRDNYYDERLGNNDWNAIRLKYEAMAEQAADSATLANVVNLMLGELNGSHLGFSITGGLPRGQAPADPTAGTRWQEQTAHLGVRFDLAKNGKGLVIRDVLPGGPADQQKAKLLPGERILSIDGTAVDPGTDLTTVLNGRVPRDVALVVADQDGKERNVTLRAISYGEVRPLLYRHWIEGNRRLVDKLSSGKLGYLHIDAMSMPSFYRFEEELFAQGQGKDGLVIDVRENGGGSTADHLLTALTQPVHAITVPRGGEPGYPQDRKVYATWNKPIIVLCNQNSFSNAEIFSHAIKTLKRGKLVGVPTAGGVISTGGTAIMDVGFLRLPFRGWYLVGDGEDLELNGAVPDLVLWPEPGQLPKGDDQQLEKAVEQLLVDVKAWQARPQPQLRKASTRPNFDPK